jgi:hypothetical protein
LINELDTQEFEIALNYWMDHINFIGHPTTLVTYDEGCYPNPNNKPTERRLKNNGRRINLSFHRNKALVSAYQAFSQYFNISDSLQQWHKKH